MSWSERLAERLVARAAARLQLRHPDWASAMLGEWPVVPPRERLQWAAGCLGASFAAPGAGSALVYPAALTGGVAAMTLLQWNADEGIATVTLLASIGLLLGVLRPRRALISGFAIGSVVGGVLAFETLSGLRPAYETHMHTLLQDLGWTVLVAPALGAAVVGGLAARRISGQHR